VSNTKNPNRRTSGHVYVITEDMGDGDHYIEITEVADFTDGWVDIDDSEIFATFAEAKEAIGGMALHDTDNAERMAWYAENVKETADGEITTDDAPAPATEPSSLPEPMRSLTDAVRWLAGSNHRVAGHDRCQLCDSLTWNYEGERPIFGPHSDAPTCPLGLEVERLDQAAPAKLSLEDAISGLDSLIDGEDPAEDDMAELLVPIKELLESYR
jgi:hypothetical protein